MSTSSAPSRRGDSVERRYALLPLGVKPVMPKRRRPRWRGKLFHESFDASPCLLTDFSSECSDSPSLSATRMATTPAWRKAPRETQQRRRHCDNGDENDSSCCREMARVAQCLRDEHLDGHAGRCAENPPLHRREPRQRPEYRQSRPDRKKCENSNGLNRSAHMGHDGNGGNYGQQTRPNHVPALCCCARPDGRRCRLVPSHLTGPVVAIEPRTSRNTTAPGASLTTLSSGEANASERILRKSRGSSAPNRR